MGTCRHQRHAHSGASRKFIAVYQPSNVGVHGSQAVWQENLEVDDGELSAERCFVRCRGAARQCAGSGTGDGPQACAPRREDALQKGVQCFL